MKSIKAIEILKTFSDDEFRQFEKLAASPYFSKGRNVIPLLKYLKKLHPVYPETKLIPEYIKKKIPSLSKASKDVLRMRFFAIEKLSKNFLSVSHFLISPHYNFTLLKELSSRSLDAAYEKELRRTEKGLLTANKHILSSLEITERIKNTQIEQKGEYTKSLNHVSKIGQYKTTKYIIEFFKNLQDHIALRNTYMSAMPPDLVEALFEKINFDSIIKLYEGSGYFGSELVIFYYNRFLFYTSGGDSKHYHKIKNLAMRVNKKYGDESNDLFQNLANCCWWAIKRGMKKYERELFKIYNTWLDTDSAILQDTKYIDIGLFKNIFVLAITLRELKWAENFLKKYSSYLNPAHGKEIVNHCYAFLYFYQGKPDKSLEEINKVVFKDYVYKMDMQMLTLIIYYETSSYENVLSLADSLKHFLSQHYDKFPQNRKDNMLFVKAITSLVKLKLDFKNKNYEKLKEFIEKEKLLPSRAWFVKKTEELNVQTL